MSLHHETQTHFCELCDGTIYGPMVWCGQDDYCPDCYLERYADSVGEALVEIAAAMGWWQD